MDKGLLTGIMDWISHPMFSDGSPVDWAAGLVLLLMISFLWTTVIKEIA